MRSYNSTSEYSRGEFCLKKENEKLNRLTSQITAAFNSYDSDNKGFLDHNQLRNFLDDIRASLLLYKTDDKIFNRIWNILDDNQDGKIQHEELLENMQEVLPIQSECGEEMENIIDKAFKDFDVDSSGFLEKPEMRLLLNLSADRIGVERCNDWQIDYILSKIDDDGNGMIDLEEFMSNYRIINQELLKNNSIKGKGKKKINGGFFQKGLAIKLEDGGENNEDFINALAKQCKKFQRNSKVKEIERINESRRSSIVDLDLVSISNMEQRKNQIPLINLVNEDPYTKLKQLKTHTIPVMKSNQVDKMLTEIESRYKIPVKNNRGSLISLGDTLTTMTKNDTSLVITDVSGNVKTNCWKNQKSSEFRPRAQDKPQYMVTPDVNSPKNISPLDQIDEAEKFLQEDVFSVEDDIERQIQKNKSFDVDIEQQNKNHQSFDADISQNNQNSQEKGMDQLKDPQVLPQENNNFKKFTKIEKSKSVKIVTGRYGTKDSDLMVKKESQDEKNRVFFNQDKSSSFGNTVTKWNKNVQFVKSQKELNASIEDVPQVKQIPTSFSITNLTDHQKKNMLTKKNFVGQSLGSMSPMKNRYDNKIDAQGLGSHRLANNDYTDNKFQKHIEIQNNSLANMNISNQTNLAKDNFFKIKAQSIPNSSPNPKKLIEKIQNDVQEKEFDYKKYLESGFGDSEYMNLLEMSWLYFDDYRQNVNQIDQLHIFKDFELTEIENLQKLSNKLQQVFLQEFFKLRHFNGGIKQYIENKIQLLNDRGLPKISMTQRQNFANNSKSHLGKNLHKSDIITDEYCKENEKNPENDNYDEENCIFDWNLVLDGMNKAAKKTQTKFINNCNTQDLYQNIDYETGTVDLTIEEKRKVRATRVLSKVAESANIMNNKSLGTNVRNKSFQISNMNTLLAPFHSTAKKTFEKRVVGLMPIAGPINRKSNRSDDEDEIIDRLHMTSLEKQPPSSNSPCKKQTPFRNFFNKKIIRT